MKIIEAISDTNIGGAGVLLCNRLACTDLKKYQTLVLLPKNSELCPRLQALGVPTVQLEGRGDRSLDALSILQYIKIITAYSPDIINTHGNLSARISAYVCRVPVRLCTRHCVYPLTAGERLLGRLNSCLSDRFIAVAHSAKENLVQMGVPPRRITVIINGARRLLQSSEEQKSQLRRALKIKKGETVIGLCARLEPCKGHTQLLRCAQLLQRENFNFKLLLMGSGSLERELKDMCARMGLSERVIFCGFVKDVAPLMSIVDINVNCSVGTETSSLALSEGMSLGKPAVVSDFGGNPYMVRHGENGFVYPTADFGKMAEYIKRLAADKALYERMSHAAYERFCRELNCESMTKKTNRLYDVMYAMSRKC